jgi:phytanoyl-CoA hydroxylase
MLPSDQQRESFDDHGWVVLRGIVSPECLAQLNRAFDPLMSPLLASSSGESSLFQLPAVCRTDDVWARHLYAGVAEFARHLIGAPSIRLLQDALLLKLPSGDGSVEPHQDYTYTGFLDPAAIVSVGLALTDATEEDGCLYVVDASHKWGLVGGFHVFSDQLDRSIHDSLSPAQRELVEHAKVPLEVHAGDVTLHHCLTFHGSYPNTGLHHRKTVVTHLFSGDCKLARGRLPPGAEGWFETDDQDHLIGASFPQLS